MAETFGLRRKTVNAFMTDEDVSRMHSVYACTALPLSRVADAFGVTVPWMRAAFKKRGLPCYPPGPRPTTVLAEIERISDK